MAITYRKIALQRWIAVQCPAMSEPIMSLEAINERGRDRGLRPWMFASTARQANCWRAGAASTRSPGERLGRDQAELARPLHGALPAPCADLVVDLL